MAEIEPREREFLQWKVQYLMSRRELDDTSLWQAPALGLTAQAFLLTIALDNSATGAARLMSSVLAFITAAASLYLIGRKRHQASLNEKEFKKLAKSLYGVELSIKFSDRAKEADYSIPWYLGLTAPVVWMIALSIFLIFDVIITAKTLYDFIVQ